MSELKELSSITSKIGSGLTPRGGNSVYTDNGISLIRSQNVLDMDFSTENLAYIDEVQAEKLKNVIVEKNDILLNITGDSIARCTIVPEEILPARVNQHVSIIRCKNTEQSKYVMYYLQYIKKYLLQISKVGGTRNALTKEAISKLPIKISEDWNRISTILDNIDRKIKINNQINQELEAMAKTLYDYWFLQFDFPDQNGKPYKSSGGKMVYNPELKCEIPEGWGVEKLGDVAYLKAGGDKPNNISDRRSKETPIPIYSNGLDNKGLYGYTNKATIYNNSLTVSARGTIGYVQRRFSPFFPIIRLISITPKEEKLIGYIENFLKSIQFENSGSVQQQLTVPQIDKLYIVIPENKLLEQYHSLTINYYCQVENNEQQNQELIQLRDWLLPMLMNGQVKVEVE